MTTTADSRIVPVEENLLAFLEGMSGNALFRTDGRADVRTYWSEVDYPLFNGLVGGRFAAGTEASRAREAIGPFLERGRPFMWWSTPSTWSEALHAALVGAGLAPDASPGMHVALAGPTPAKVVPGLTLEVTSPATAEVLCRVMTEGFDMPEALVEPLTTLVVDLDQRLVNVLARVDGVPVACGSLFVTGPTAGLYNIATLAEARGRGIGYAVTRELLELARLRGCTEAILHASEMGRPVYERLGFVAVCEVPQYVWVPAS